MRKREKNKSIIQQVKESLDSQLAIGSSKHADKLAGCLESRIYSWDTYRAYLRHACDFTKWAKQEHGCRTLDDCRKYAAEYISLAEKIGYSPSTVKLMAASVAKVYQCSTESLGIHTKPRKRADITRSRGTKKSDKHFSEERNADLVAFCRGTGLRKHKELEQLRGSQLEQRDGLWYIVDVKGKGGKIRDIPVYPKYADIVVRYCQKAGDGLVWPRVSSHADVHSYRAAYAAAWYQDLARPVDKIPKKDRYICRNDKAGVVYDKAAMRQVSRFLGHNRISVIAAHYLY